ncbi:hypothetical protein CDQ84_09600 [Clostridium thermosuccinogenes]|uniref:Outer membrane lipoprotein BamD-like domain-containing protein n=1 Tax=Clostridium thermosuccinogenes TaxID=84032 RepID=A0A2K2FE54_9CLOT|nr:tetratricopeptide repeat protein [Pseudoclostridium thermosuccinogenes]AUS98488.1 hypothetical protein CDO33_19735 [Pseudoclostridium thermosuccinogenes]PNT97059.1 hypothetical protein CDQ85_09450 [Pseudoclostridium thermosuccinogenes]PNT98990.1 hypothetical protein CDQ84_09600 [Pseudoclostridium thermosuccinogenes]
MSDGSNKNFKIWVYAIVLFSFAFIVLLLTAYSQIKLNNSIAQYKSQLSDMESQYDNDKINLNATIELNEELSKKVDELKEELEASEKKIKEYEEKLKQQEENSNKDHLSYEALIKAQMEYEKGNYTSSAMILHKECNPDDLESSGLEKYNQLKSEVYKKASHQFYAEGYTLYKNKDYKEAINKFKMSLELVGNEYYSDDCYYFIAYSYYYNGDNEQAKKFAESLLEKYPDSTYKKATEDFLILLK